MPARISLQLSLFIQIIEKWDLPRKGVNVKLVAIFSTFNVAAWILAAFLAAPVMAMPVLNGGWEVDANIDASDRVLAANADNEDGAYIYSLARPAVFRITDAFVAGDVWNVYDFGSLILTTAFVAFPAGFGDNAPADAAWTDAAYSSGEVFLTARSHSITVQGDGAGGMPARFFVRMDAPEPGTVALLCFGLAGILASRRLRA